MNLRNFLSPGDFVVPVPTGLLLTLVYGVKGTLEDVYEEHEETRFHSVKDTLMTNLRRGDWQVPLHINFKDGSTRVRGVLHPKKENPITDKLGSDSYNEYMLSRAAKHPDEFEFLAVHAETFAAVLMGYGPIQQWMKISGFSVISGFLTPVDLSSKNFEATWKRVAKSEKSLRFDVAAEYVNFTSKGASFAKTNSSQMEVNATVDFMESDGRMMSELVTTPKLFNHIINFSDKVSKNIQEKCIVFFNDEGKVIKVVYSDNASKHPLDREFTCPVCGNSYHIPAVGEVCCPDTTCGSRQLPRINSFLKKLKLPLIKEELHKKMLASYHRLSVPDIFSFSPYKEMKLDCTLYDLVYALVPPSVCSDPSLVRQFVNHCNNRADTLLYYLQKVDEAFESTSMKSNKFCASFVKWLETPYNVLEIQALLSMPDNIHIVSSNIKYEGAPIFRGTTICVTGKFLRGSYEDIEAILKGYSAEVVKVYTSDTKIVVIGGIHENIDGMSVQHAKKHGIDVYEEDDFFKAFEIDKDMAENL